MNSWDIDFYAGKLHRFIHALWVHLVFWPSFVLHSCLTICDCLWFTEGLFWPLQIRKTFLFECHWFQCSENQRLCANGMLQAGLAQNIVARHFGVHRNTIQSLLRRFRQSGNTRDSLCSGRPHVMSHQQGNHIQLVHLRRSIPGLRPISSRTVHNRLRDHPIRLRCPTICPLLLPRHHASRLMWCRHNLRFRRHDWANILFTDESCFHLDSSDGWSGVYHCIGECYAGACLIQYRLLGGYSVIVWGRNNRTWQDTISCCCRKYDQNTLSGWNCSVLCYSVHPSSGQQRHFPAVHCKTTCCIACTWLPDTAECWCATMASDFTRSFTHWAHLGWNGTTVTPSAKSASDVSGNWFWH